MSKVFISHASEDKDSFVRPLANSLIDRKFDVWYDEYSLKWGDSLLQKINEGLSQCDYAIVVFSDNFFKKRWPQSELNGLFALEQSKGKLILPIWKDIDHNEISQYSPIIADRTAMMASDGIETIVNELENLIKTTNRAVALHRSSAILRMKQAISHKQEIIESKEKLYKASNVLLVRNSAEKIIDKFRQTMDEILPGILGSDFKKHSTKDHELNIKYYASYQMFNNSAGISFGYENNFTNTVSDAKLIFKMAEIDHSSYPPSSDVVGGFEYGPFINKSNNVLWTDQLPQCETVLDEDIILENIFSQIEIFIKNHRLVED